MALTKIGASLGGAADTLLVTQTNHGFVDFDRGKAVRMLSTGLYALATADAIANADAVGIIIQRIDANTLLLALSGRVTVDGCVPTGTAGTVLFLPVTSTKNVENTGLLLATEPSTASQVSKPMAVITISGSEMILFQMRGEVITTGVIAVADNSVTSAKIVDGAIVNADVNASAAINFSKMENLTNSRALVSDGSGDVSVSAVTSTEVGYLDGVTSAIQTQIDAAGGDFSNGGDNGALVLGTNDSNSLTLKTNNTARMVIASGGQITKPTQPAFCACVGSNKDNVTGGGTWYVIAYDTDSGGNGAWFDTGGNYNTSTYTFTAPVAGVYFFAATVRLLETGTYNANNVLTEFRTTTNGSSSMMNYRFYHGDYIADVNGVLGIHWSALVNLPASGTCQAVVYVAGSSDNIDVDGDTGTGMSYFSGYLLH